MRRFGGLATVVGLAALLGGCSVGEVGAVFDGFGWPSGVSQQASQMYDLWIGSVIAALLVGFFVWGLIFWCVIAYRKRGEQLPVQTRFNLPIEVLYTVLPFLIIAVLFYYTVIVQDRVNAVSAKPDVTVEVVAFKWNWQFNYRSGPGVEAQTVASTTGTSDIIPLLVLPVGQNIRFEQHAKDVIHSFWVPDLLFKRDVFPGNVRNEFQVTIDQEGRYVGRCAELCGTYHSMMNFEVVAVSPQRYQQYVDALKAGQTQTQAMATIGFTGTQSYAVTTEPFETKRDANLEAAR